MNFFIKQNSEEPSLKLRLIDDGKSDKSNFIDLLSDSVITFDMVDPKTGEPILFDGECFVSNTMTKFKHSSYDYCIVYKFTKDDTQRKGIFEGTITVKFTDTLTDSERLLLLPITEKLYIHVI